jgi:hypothetical protein
MNRVSTSKGLFLNKEQLIGESILSRSIQPPNFLEIVTTREFLTRLKIGRTKLFGLKKNGTLVPGRHFFQNGRVLRWVWGPDLIEALHKNPVEKPSPINQHPKQSETNTTRPSMKSTINLSY